MRVMHDLLGHRADQPAGEERLAAVAQHDVVHAVRFGVMHDLLRRMAYEHDKADVATLVKLYALVSRMRVSPRA